MVDIMTYRRRIAVAAVIIAAMLLNQALGLSFVRLVIALWNTPLFRVMQHNYNNNGKLQHGAVAFITLLLLSQGIEPNPGPMDYSCMWCDKPFDVKDTLLTHEQQCETFMKEISGRQLMCQWCGQSFQSFHPQVLHERKCVKKTEACIQRQTAFCKRKEGQKQETLNNLARKLQDVKRRLNDHQAYTNTLQQRREHLLQDGTLPKAYAYIDRQLNELQSTIAKLQEKARDLQSDHQQLSDQLEVLCKRLSQLQNRSSERPTPENIPPSPKQPSSSPKPTPPTPEQTSSSRKRPSSPEPTAYTVKRRSIVKKSMQKKRQDPQYRDKESRQQKEYKKQMSAQVRSAEKAASVKWKTTQRHNPVYREAEKQQNQKRMQSSRASEEVRVKEDLQRRQSTAQKKFGTGLDEAIDIFLAATSKGPIFVCSACHQTHFEDNVSDVASLRPGNHQALLNQCLTGYRSVLQTEWICLACKREIYMGQVPKLSIANKVGFPEKPPELDLYPLEETLIAPLLPFMTIRSLPVCGHFANGQKMVVGNVVHVPNDIASTVQVLPRLCEDMGTVTVNLKRKKCYKTSVFTQNVRPTHVVKALDYLVKHSEMYQRYNIQIPSWLQHLDNSDHPNLQFFEGNQSQAVPTNTPTDAMQDESVEDDDDPFEDAQPSHGNMDTLLAEHIVTDHCDTHLSSNQQFQPSTASTHEILNLAPGEGKIPVFKEPKAEYLAFPTIFCGQERPDNDERTRKVYISDLYKAELRNVDPRVCLNIPNILWRGKSLQFQHVASKVTLALRRIPGAKHKSVTAQMLLDQAQREQITRLDEGYAIFRTVRNTPPYFEKQKKDVLAMVRQLGIPTIFFSLSAADCNWVSLLKCLGKLVDNQLYSTEYIQTEMDFEKKCQLVASHPSACSRYFHHRVQKFLHHVLQSPYSPFGTLQDFMYRVEFQKRGSPHIHGLMWIANAPIHGSSSDEEICDYIDSCITCHLPSDPKLFQYVKLQLHKHSRTCQRIIAGKKTCRFGAPWPPMKKNFHLGTSAKFG